MSMTVETFTSGCEPTVWNGEEEDCRRGLGMRGEPRFVEAIFTFGPEGSRLTTREVVLIKKGEGEENQTLRKIDRVFGVGKYEVEIELVHKFGGGESSTNLSGRGSCSDNSGNKAYIRGNIDNNGNGEIATGVRSEGDISPEQHRIDRGE